MNYDRDLPWYCQDTSEQEAEDERVEQEAQDNPTLIEEEDCFYELSEARACLAAISQTEG